MTQAGVFWVTVVAATIALLAGAVEWRRSNRRDLDRVGIVPWGALSLLAFVGALAGVAVLLR